MDFLDKKQFFKAKSKTHFLQVLCFHKQKQTKTENFGNIKIFFRENKT